MDDLMKRVKKEWKLYGTVLWMFLSMAVFTWIGVE